MHALRSSRSLVSIFAFVGLLGGCEIDEGASLDLQIEGVDGDVEDSYAIDWDGGVTWTREVGCALSEEGSEGSYHLDATDRSQGELTVAMTVEAYSGPGDYDRDEFQPTPLLSIDWTDPATSEVWHLGTDAGGRCAITITDPSRTGTLSCIDVAVFRDRVRTADLASVTAVWSCGSVGREDVSATKDRRWPGPSW